MAISRRELQGPSLVRPLPNRTWIRIAGHSTHPSHVRHGAFPPATLPSRSESCARNTRASPIAVGFHRLPRIPPVLSEQDHEAANMEAVSCQLTYRRILA